MFSADGYEVESALIGPKMDQTPTLQSSWPASALVVRVKFLCNQLVQPRLHRLSAGTIR